MNKRVDINGELQNTKEVNKVYKTNDLKIFKFTKYNRNVITSEAMLKQAREGFINPIVVNENMVVIDGQHRVHHARIEDVSIEYIIKPGLDKHDIVRMNTTQKPWSLKNHIEAYANQGLEEYVALLNLVNEGYAGVTDIISIAQDRSFVNERLQQKVKDGEFEFFNFQKTLDHLKYYEKFREETKTPKRSKIALAIYEMFRIKNFDGDRLIQKVIQTNFDTDIKARSYSFTEALQELIIKYNSGLKTKSPYYIDFYINSQGVLKIANERHEWTTKKATLKEPLKEE